MSSNIVVSENNLVLHLLPPLLPIPIPTTSSQPLHTTPPPTLPPLDPIMAQPSSTFHTTTQPRMLKTASLLPPHSYVMAQSTSATDPILAPHTLKIAPRTHNKIPFSSTPMLLNSTPTPHTSNLTTWQPTRVHQPSPNQQPT